MIDVDDVDLCLTVLMGGTTHGWDEASVRIYRDTLRMYEDPVALAQACREVISNYGRTDKPPIGLIKTTYESVLRRRAATERPALPEPDGAIRPSEGLKIAQKAYEAAYGRPAPANIFDIPDPDVFPKTNQRDIELAESTIACGGEYAAGWISTYTKVVQVFKGDHRRCRGALRALEQSRRINWGNNGVLLLHRSIVEGAGEPI